jgi:hypothetical protein
MAATNYTPIQLYYSTTASAVPLAANLAQGELAINITDGKLYYEDGSGVVQVIASKGAGTIGGSTTQIQYNNAGALAGNAAMTFNSGTSTTTLTTLNLTNALGAVYGGTGQTSYTTGDLLYSSASNTLAKLAIGTANYILAVNSAGTNVEWAAPSAISVNTATNLAGGVAGSVPYQSAAATTTFLAIGAANRVMTSTGTAPQWVTSLTSLTGVSSSSITNTSLISGRVVYSGASGVQTDSANLTFNGTTLSAGGFSTTGLSTLVQTVKIGDSNFSGVAVFAPATPAKLYIGTGTVTDATSAIGATNATGAVASLAITPIAATNTSVTYTNASTLYIAGAPSNGTNISITNPYALYIAAGASYLGGNTAVTGALSSTADSYFATSSGNVGIGASSPVYQTQIYGTGQTTSNLTDAGNKGGSLLLNTPTVSAGDGGALLFGAGGTGAKPFAAIKGLLVDGGGNTTGALAFSTRNATADTALTERMYLAASGAFGLGTSSPATLFHMLKNGAGGSAPNQPELRIQHNDINGIGVAGSNGGILGFVNLQQDNTPWAADSIWGRINFSPSQPTSGAAQLSASILAAAEGVLGGQTSTTYLAFYTTDATNGGNNGEKMRLTGARGCLQISSTNNTGANAKLVVGTGLASANGRVVINTGNTNIDALVLENWDGSATSYGPRISFSNSGRGSFTIGASDGANNFDICQTWGTPQVRVTSAGNVVIGNTSASARLYAYTPNGAQTAIEALSTYGAASGKAGVFTIGNNSGTSGGGYGIAAYDKSDNSGGAQAGYGVYISAPYDGTNATGNTYSLIKYGLFVDDIYSYYGINNGTNSYNWGLYIKGGANNYMAGNLGLGTASPSSYGRLAVNSTAAGGANVALTKENSGTSDQNGQTLYFNNSHNSNTGRSAGVLAGQILWQFSQPTSGVLQYAGEINVTSEVQGGGSTASSLKLYSSGGLGITINSSANTVIAGSLSKASGSFRIDHPLPELEETHQLVHSFIEGPQADLIYRGKVNLVNGTATVNIDTVSTMTEGTFVTLCRDVQCFTTNESDWTAVRGSVTGNILTIEAEDNTSTAGISWMVIGERKDKHMMDTDWTDDNGKVIVEPLKEQPSTTVEGA